MVPRRLFIACALPLLVAMAPPAAQAPELQDTVRRAGEYIEAYSTKVSGVSLEELFLLIETTGGQTRVPVRIASDVVLARMSSLLLGLRDPVSVDTRRIRERGPRLLAALRENTDASHEQAQRYVRENAAFLGHNVVIWYTDPVVALQFGAPANHSRLTFKLEGAKKLNGVQTYGLGFKEKPDSTPVLDQIPGKAQSWGRLWVEAGSGAVHMTELWVQSQTDTVRSTITFEQDAKLSMLLPRKASHNLEWREYGSNVTGTIGRATQKLSFEANAEYGNPQYVPLGIIR
jgi:hypothetical protein